MENKIQLDKDSIRPLFFKYYIPILTSLLSVTIHQVIDGAILANYVGKEGVAAVGMFGTIITVFIAFGLTLVIGGGILIGKNIGAGNYAKAQRVFQFTTTLAILFGLIITILTPFVVNDIVSFLVGNSETELFDKTFDYMFWGFMWIPIFLLRMILGNVVSHDGAPKVTRNASIFGVVVNIILDILLIIVFPFGTEGASIATGISVLLSVGYLVFYINKEKGHLRIRNYKFTLKLKEWKELLNYGVPSFVSEISFSIGLLLINMRMAQFGAVFVSVFGIINYLSFIFLRLFTAAMVSALPIMSFNIGAKLPNRVLGIFKFSLLFTFVLGIAVVSLGFLIPEFLVTIFSGSESEEFKKMASASLGLFFFFFIVAGPNYILGAYLQSIGKLIPSIILNLLKGCVLVVIPLFLIPDYLGHEKEWTWLSRTFAEIGAFILVGFYLFNKREAFFSDKAILK
ncbi:MATE family efflux transporter [Flavivirga aquimarina]|uniref:MATE family efflux transporter n=1 Tax=Flavivirga aquimarina TaxID=2027862 RepID=A0ABT8W7B3_9FLAO|nr:MATE family efflux transporter [Flavivirga aquimarina]MDO5969017.1 MATE family efflux transporter [Flavivirga aquimarina]